VRFTDGIEAAVPLTKEALRAFRAEDTSGADDQPGLWLAAYTASDIWDDESWRILTVRHMRVAREIGDISVLPLSLDSLVVVHLFAGERAAAAAQLAEIQAIGEATGIAMAPFGALTMAAQRGDEPAATAMIEALTVRSEGSGVIVANWARSLLLNGLARYRDAVAAAGALARYPNWALSELIEAAVRSGQPELAAGAYERLAATAGASGTDWALGLLARCDALLATDQTADALYQLAIEHLGRTSIRIELARAHLLYGEWLRRENRRSDARAHLRAAYDMFTAAGAEAFAERARHELAATGEQVADRTPRASNSLTAQEAHIAGLAGSGLTNAQIGAQLFLSPHTVEWHLRKVFTKLGITSRRQLRPSDAG
jgi:DNA-binding CsgD family transcriptional regulator